MEENNENAIIDEKTKEDTLSKTTIALLDNEEVTELNTQEYSDFDIQGMIHEIRGQQVMLDSDLAKLFGYELKKMNQQVKRNDERFPDDFMFQITRDEIPESLKSQFVTLNNNDNKRGLHIKKMPYAFTEQGVNQLSSVLKGPIAVKQSV
ncbi:MAG: ORF6N domain-containing protein, partial [Coprobacillus sp.]